MGCDDNQKLISSKQCLDFLTNQAQVLEKIDKVSLKNAVGRILAIDLIAGISVPEFDNSAMDGYAINLPTKPKPPYSFDLVGRIAAGEVGGELLVGQAAKIFTGAKMPKGGNCVAIVERSSDVDGKVEIFGVLKKGENIRPKGDDIKQGEVILKAGKKLTPSDIGLCASIGISEIVVFAKVKIGVFFSGDELVEPDEKLVDGKIYNSNRYTITTLLTTMNFELIDIGNIADDFDLTVKTLDSLSTKCDVIITTGGVSVGEEDHIKPAVEKLGSIEMWAIKMKPGKPLAYGKVNQTHFVGLPGNPVSALATLHLFIAPFLRKMSGEQNYNNKTTKVQIGFGVGSRFRREFMRVRLDNSTIPPTAIAFKNQSSGVLSSMSWADGLLEIPDETIIKKGDFLDYYGF